MRGDRTLGAAPTSSLHGRRSIPFSSGTWVQVGALACLSGLIALHWLQPGRVPASSPLGTYSLGRGGLIAIPTYLGLALALAAASLGCLQTLGAGSIRLLAALCLGAGAVATATAGVFPSDGAVPPAFPGSRDGWVHLVAILMALPLYLLGPLLLTQGTRGDPRWDGVRTLMTALVIGLAGAGVFLIVGAVPLGLVGAGERAVAVLLLSWLVVVGRRVRLLRHRVVEGVGPSGDV